MRSSFTARYLLHLRWNDTRLGWASNKLEVTVLDADSIWTPHLVQYSDLSTDPTLSNEGFGRKLEVFSDGTVYWQLSTITTGLCRITTRYFPFDKHRCGIVFGPEANYNIFFRKMFPKPVISAYSQANPSWNLTQTRASAIPYDFHDEYRILETPNKVYPNQGVYSNPSVIQFAFEFKRSPSMIVNLWLVPLCLIIFSSNIVYLIVGCLYTYFISNSLQVWYPRCSDPSHCDRASYIVAIAMSTIFLLGIIQTELPSAADDTEAPLVTNIYKTGLATFALQGQD